ncbi:MAG: hypothetical protein VZR00_03555 [Lachnospiraceae bacterium]|jgi:hypothetical protein|nr:hypothetical protein [Lachnospiraceae bacterium]
MSRAVIKLMMLPADKMLHLLSLLATKMKKLKIWYKVRVKNTRPWQQLEWHFKKISK